MVMKGRGAPPLWICLGPRTTGIRPAGPTQIELGWVNLGNIRQIVKDLLFILGESSVWTDRKSDRQTETHMLLMLA